MKESLFEPKKLKEISNKIRIKKKEKETFFKKMIKAFLS